MKISHDICCCFELSIKYGRGGGNIYPLPLALRGLTLLEYLHIRRGGWVAEWFGALAPTAPYSTVCGVVVSSHTGARSRNPPHLRGIGDCDIVPDSDVCMDG